jgi:Rps23 Pro-64 3,4-dihydroxylase Tpa1-like proline 4-hydroxylase
MELFLYEDSTSLDISLCNRIIELYENEENKYEGVTRGGLNKSVKDTTDFVIPYDASSNMDWLNINDILYNELNKNLHKYIVKIRQYLNNETYILFDAKCLTENLFMIQKYIKNRGHYIYHNDASFEPDRTKYRVLTYLWYLNDITEGGETEFWGNYKIKPTAGKLLIFPSSWSFPHCGKMPISDNKYIITGWLYLNY